MEQPHAHFEGSRRHHALKGEYEVLIRIGSWNVLRGQMRRKDLDAVIAWANSHEEELRNEWTRLNG
ncbi:DUF4160 domain-containing protein [Mesorhizobium sp. B263B1A]|uniref:DUF4160 domain-containing protein n=1 Tax=unclassified Mesorhizobium TaxID=325217 RepID=UPI00112AA7C6|nr:DUF4160 domain-containing protein [Mesorhizobium sp. BR1-1-14]MCA0028399.1 DUF4160 domain-containing protein [Mesorhizobium sp. B263B1A]TPJ99005.1 DUF4160 domain-containing protein [Mesorhizobium sp. B2-5-12]TPK29169.1 DUF4160 domain-containing protein [Mesorhizobium sp. B2-5-6]TPK38478.1 DUF4160 domain-containing protein [Mesorhizobium sp. B2-5-3]TPN34973.1 DUF4160 domain-containing protein [Mesorhizobium sp. B1-1-6]